VESGGLYSSCLPLRLLSMKDIDSVLLYPIGGIAEDDD
jgi:hypothetical protein